MRKCISVENLKDMNEYTCEKRKRGRSLLIVEGDHEKNKLFRLIFKCFPEMNISMDDIWIYGTNIYVLYGDIVKEYGSEWADEEDIDLPFVISKKRHPENLCYKEDFINIILIFDYERHDTYFSETKILEMQKYFADAADMGKLYINYPMIESYQHLKTLPDHEYEDRKVPVSLRPGRKYKALVGRETAVSPIIELPYRLDDLLAGRFGISDTQKREECCNAVLEIADKRDMESSLRKIAQNISKDSEQSTLEYQLRDWIVRAGYADAGRTFWQYVRSVFQEIICHNICKANKILNNQYQMKREDYKKCFDNLELTKILHIQNIASRNSNTGYIWVLNTCVFFVAEYNFALVLEAPDNGANNYGADFSGRR